MNTLLEQRIASCEKELIALKTQNSTTADSSKLYRLFVELPAIINTSTSQNWTVELMPSDGRQEVIVHPIFTTGVIFDSDPNSDSACCQYPDNKFKILCRYYSDGYSTATVLTAPSLTVYSNQELILKSTETRQV